MTTISPPVRHHGSLLKELDLDKDRFLALIERAVVLKRAKAEGTERPGLRGKNLALIFEKNSTRTRCAFEVAAADQGAATTFLGPSGSHIGREESIPDTARVLGRLFDGIEFRGFAQETVEQIADYAGVPVWNGLTDEWHPTQMLADVMTMIEHRRAPVEAIGYSFLGDGRGNIARSLLVTGALLGMDVRIVAPRELWPPRGVIDIARELATTSGARVSVTDDVVTGVDGVDFVYTDVWVSMGEPAAQWDTRVPLLRPYRVTSEVMVASGKPDTLFMHCLPCVHDRSTELGERLYEQFGLDGAEVTNEVFESEQSIVFDQSENRMHTIKSILVSAYAD
jgi:ornithine carbamoyltransferase